MLALAGDPGGGRGLDDAVLELPFDAGDARAVVLRVERDDVAIADGGRRIDGVVGRHDPVDADRLRPPRRVVAGVVADAGPENVLAVVFELDAGHVARALVLVALRLAVELDRVIDRRHAGEPVGAVEHDRVGRVAPARGSDRGRVGRQPGVELDRVHRPAAAAVGVVDDPGLQGVHAVARDADLVVVRGRVEDVAAVEAPLDALHLRVRVGAAHEHVEVAEREPAGRDGRVVDRVDRVDLDQVRVPVVDAAQVVDDPDLELVDAVAGDVHRRGVDAEDRAARGAVELPLDALDAVPAVVVGGDVDDGRRVGDPAGRDHGRVSRAEDRDLDVAIGPRARVAGLVDHAGAQGVLAVRADRDLERARVRRLQRPAVELPLDAVDAGVRVRAADDDVGGAVLPHVGVRRDGVVAGQRGVDRTVSPMREWMLPASSTARVSSR